MHPRSKLNSFLVPGSDSSPRLTFDSLNLANGMPDYAAYSSGASFTTGSPVRPFTPPDSICPPVLNHLSAGELSSDGTQSGRRSRNSAGTGAGSPASVHAPLPTHRNQHRFNPIAAPRANAKERKRRAPKEEYGSDDEDEEDFQPSTAANSDV